MGWRGGFYILVHNLGLGQGNSTFGMRKSRMNLGTLVSGCAQEEQSQIGDTAGEGLQCGAGQAEAVLVECFA